MRMKLIELRVQMFHLIVRMIVIVEESGEEQG